MDLSEKLQPPQREYAVGQDFRPFEKPVSAETLKSKTDQVVIKGQGKLVFFQSANIGAPVDTSKLTDTRRVWAELELDEKNINDANELTTKLTIDITAQKGMVVELEGYRSGKKIIFDKTRKKAINIGEETRELSNPYLENVSYLSSMQARLTKHAGAKRKAA